MRNYRSLVSLVVCVMLFALLSPVAGAVSTTTIQMKLALGSKQAVINDVYGPELDVPPVLINGQIYLPLKNVGDKLGISVEWNGKTNKVDLTSSNVKVQFDIFNKQIEWNGSTIPFDNAAALQDGKLFVRLNWITEVVGARYTYDPLTKQIDIYYLQSPPGLTTDASGNSKPVAKFTFGKQTYRIGEPVKYIDLSYDPDAEGIASYEWSGKEDAFFASGTYPITLKVKDGNGKASEQYSRNIVIEDKIYVPDTLAYKLHFQPIGTAFETNWSELWGHFWKLPMVPKQVTEDNSRKLLVSDSPETIKETGILYQDKVNGKARLYADHVNGTKDNLQYVIIARNTSLTKEVTIRTTNKGEVYPSIYANLIGHEASVDFLLHDPVTDNEMTVPPGQALAYVRMPDFFPDQGVNVFYDVETDGEVEFSFVAMNPTEPTPTAGSLNAYKLLDFTGNVRGSFPVSDVAWNVDLTDLKQPSRLIIGDGKDDPFVKGYDTQRKQEVYNEGNYGVVYNIHLNKPPKMAVLILAMGGPFKGPFKINGEFHMVPDSGLLPAFEKIQVLTRTTGDEEGVDIEFTPPAGSAFPIDLIFYPLGDLPE